jgi:hypothetical protein
MSQILLRVVAMAASVAAAMTMVKGTAFATAPLSTPQLPVAVPPTLRGGNFFASPRAEESMLPSGAALCAGTTALLIATMSRVIMRSGGASHMPKIKGAKKMAMFRPRKNYGTHGARKVPRRYELYDILEEIDETIPTYTVISEPEEPLEPVKDVPLTERYPWAGPIDSVCEEKKELESSVSTRLEPYFSNFTREGLPPWGRRQQYVFRRGWPRYHYPPWINKPKVGDGVRLPGSLPFLKDRRPAAWQLSDKQLAKREAERKAKRAERKAKRLAETQDEVDDALSDMEK